MNLAAYLVGSPRSWWVVFLVFSLFQGCETNPVPGIYDAGVPGTLSTGSQDQGPLIDGPLARLDAGKDGAVLDMTMTVLDASISQDATVAQDARVLNPDFGGVLCSSETGRAVRPGPFRCAQPPRSVLIESNTHRYRIFTYEASHPLATRERAFPCAREAGESTAFMAPDETTEACSVGGVRPWFNVLWRDAKAACEQIGWRLCTGSEYTRACGGPGGFAYTFGALFEQGMCNLREAFRVEGRMFASESPTGFFERCVSAEGIYDMTGNLWEWNADQGNEFSSEARFHQGAGWRTVAEQHRDGDMQCSRTMTIPESSAAMHHSSMVGFRCCQTVQ